MLRRPPETTRTNTLIPDTTRFRSSDKQIADNVRTEQIYPPATPEEIDVAATHIFDAPTEGVAADWTMPQNWQASRSEEHTSELQSLLRISYADFCLKKI